MWIYTCIDDLPCGTFEVNAAFAYFPDTDKYYNQLSSKLRRAREEVIHFLCNFLGLEFTSINLKKRTLVILHDNVSICIIGNPRNHLARR